MSLGPISQLYVLSQRGDSIIVRDFRGDAIKGTADIFFRRIKLEPHAPPVFRVEMLNFAYVRESGLYFMVTTHVNTSPVLALEWLRELIRVIKDFCGSTTEETIRKNFALVYEVLDETIDCGYFQSTATEKLKSLVANTAIRTEVGASATAGLHIAAALGKTTAKPATAVSRPVNDSSGSNEIFVDLVERLTLLMNTQGNVINSKIDGTLRMKSYLHGNPMLRLGLNDDLVIGAGAGGAVCLQDCNFHDCVDLTDFDATRQMSLQPPGGEFTLLNYRCALDPQRLPFRVVPTVERVGSARVELTVLLRADIPEQFHGVNVVVTIGTPKSATSVGSDLREVAGSTAEYDPNKHTVRWAIRKIQGGTEFACKVRCTFGKELQSVPRDLGPLSLNFEVPMLNVSGLQVKFLRVMDASASNPSRWVRYVTSSQNYVVRV